MCANRLQVNPVKPEIVWLTTSSDFKATAASVHGPGHVTVVVRDLPGVFIDAKLSINEDKPRYEDIIRLLCRAAPAQEYPSIGVTIRSPFAGSVFDFITC